MKYEFEIFFGMMIIATLFLFVAGTKWLLSGILLFCFGIFYEVGRIRRILIKQLEEKVR